MAEGYHVQTFWKATTCIQLNLVSIYTLYIFRFSWKRGCIKVVMIHAQRTRKSAYLVMKVEVVQEKLSPSGFLPWIFVAFNPSIYGYYLRYWWKILVHRCWFCTTFCLLLVLGAGAWDEKKGTDVTYQVNHQTTTTNTCCLCCICRKIIQL